MVYRYEGRVFSSNQRDLCSLHCLSMPVPTAAGKSVSKLSAVCVCVYNATIIYGTFFTALLPCGKEAFLSTFCLQMERAELKLTPPKCCAVLSMCFGM